MKASSLLQRSVPLFVAGGLVASACSDTADGDLATGARNASDPDLTPGSAAEPAVEIPPRLELDVPDPNAVYDPIRGGETPPQGYRQLLARDAIEPVYDPVFTTADGVDWPQESLVIGVDLEGEARAYPVGFLNRREIVNDDHRGIPTLVTW